MSGRRHAGRANGSSAGSVSIYFAAFTSSFVLLSALLIDFSRIAAFRHQAELAVQAGARSVLSAYDPGMLARYGLFIRGGDDGDELLRKTLEGSGAAAAAGDAFRYLTVEWTEAGVIESRPLADHGIFMRQVQEEMKYKAPIDLSLELASRFKGASAALREAADTVDLLERMRQLYERREAALDRVLQQQEQTGVRLLDTLREIAPYPSAPLNGNLSAGTFRHLADGANRYRDYWDKRQADEASEQAYQQAVEAGEEQLPPLRPHAAAVAAYESSAASVAGRLGDLAPGIRTNAESSLALASEALREAAAANEEMSRLAAETTAVPGDYGHRDIADPDDPPAVDRDTVGTLAEIRQTAKQIVLDAAFFAAYEAELQTELEKSVNVSLLANRGAAELASVVHARGNDHALQTAVRQLQTALDDYASAYAADGSVIRQRRSLLGQHRSQDAEREALAQEAQAEWTAWTGMQGRIGNLQGTPEERETFRHANRLARDNLDWNGLHADQPGAGMQANDPAAARDAALQGANDGLAAMAGALTELRNALYLAEYAHGRLTRMTPAQVKQMLEGEAVSLSLDRMEMEYALYGFDSAAGNLAAAYGEIFAFRLAIRTMEGLVECRSAVHPLLILAGALVYGLRHAIQDVRDLLERDAVPLSRYLQVNTTYADYLRLFFLLHGHSSGSISRCLAVVESGMKLDLTGAYTYVGAEGTASLKLWFFPGLLRLLNRSDQWGGVVKGNRYEAAYTAEFAYQ